MQAKVYLLSATFVINLLRKNLFLVLGNVIVRYSKALKKGYFTLYFITAKLYSPIMLVYC